MLKQIPDLSRKTERRENDRLATLIEKEIVGDEKMGVLVYSFFLSSSDL